MIAIIAAALPGVDPVSMIIEMVPLLVLFELSILLAKVLGRAEGVDRRGRAIAPGVERQSEQMASKRNSNEHRMVFDIRGKRGNVVKVVYAVLALLMGLSLFLVVGPVNIGSILSATSSSASNAAKPFEEQAERIEVRLKKSPEDPKLLASLTRARINAGNSSIEDNLRRPAGADERSGAAVPARQRSLVALPEGDRRTERRGRAADRADLRHPGRTSGTGEFEANVEAAAEAQQIVAEQRPSINALTTLAIYQYFTFDYKQARKTEAEAIALAEGKFEREGIENQMQEYEKRAKELQKELKKLEQAAKSAGGGSGSKEAWKTRSAASAAAALGE